MEIGITIKESLFVCLVVMIALLTSCDCDDFRGREYTIHMKYYSDHESNFLIDTYPEWWFILAEVDTGKHYSKRIGEDTYNGFSVGDIVRACNCNIYRKTGHLDHWDCNDTTRHGCSFTRHWIAMANQYLWHEGK